MIIKRKKNISQSKQQEVTQKEIEPQIQVQNEEFDFENISFKEREERRQGNRRRGYRRIDDRNLVSRAQEEAILIKENAAKEGYQKGLQDATEEVEMIKQSIQEFFQYKDQVLNVVSHDIIDIALDVAQKIIKKESQTDKTILLNLILDIFNNNISKENKITIKAGTDDAQYLKSQTEEIVRLTQTDAKINIVEDSKLKGGGVIIETTNGIVDASFKTQFELLAEALRKN